MLPALLPNFSVKTPKESIIPTGTGAGLPISANASLIRAQSNLRILCPAHTLPFKMLKILSATSSNSGALSTASLVIPSHLLDFNATADKSFGFMRVLKLSSSTSFRGQTTIAPNSSTQNRCPALLGTVVSKSKNTISAVPAAWLGIKPSISPVFAFCFQVFLGTFCAFCLLLPACYNL